jgi:membrane associated rhomboid family serine protease
MAIWDRIKQEFNKSNSAIRQIIIINLAAFIFTILVKFFASLGSFNPDNFLQYFYLPSDLSTLLVRPWTLITNIFFHAGFSHIFWNMILLYFLGRILEDYLSPKKIWQIFLLGGVLGGLTFITAFNLFPAFSDVVSFKQLLGASGGVTAIIVAIGVHLPYYVVRPFGLFQIQMRWVALIFVFRDLYTFPMTNNAGGLLAHLGGALFGLLYILNLQGRINIPSFNLNLKPKSKLKVNDSKASKPGRRSDARPNQEEIDAILDKISNSGYDSLTAKEKEILFKASK